MTVTLHQKAAIQPTQWSGGQTWELDIFPNTARYSERNFRYRISTASVEVDESEFTPLADVERLIMVLEGELTLQHIGQKPLLLTPYLVHPFHGGLQTNAKGKVTDFNLMLREGATGSMGILNAQNLQDKLKKPLFTHGVLMVHRAGVYFKTTPLQAGDFLSIRNWQASDELPLTIEEESIMVYAGMLEGA